MKTITTKWAATFLTVVSIIAASNIALAQHRPNQNKNGEVRMEKKRETGKNTAQEKSALKSYNSGKANKNSSLKARRTTQNLKTTNFENRHSHQTAKNNNNYSPGKNSKGNPGHWSSKSVKRYCPSGHINRNFYPKHKHSSSKHWDKHWESYHWNVNSWADYYNGYHPYSYKFHKYYYVHPEYGHVIRKFQHRPEYFVHKNVKYYNYNGHLFRYFKGVGYVLTDIPYGMVFQKLPAGYERVYINGYLYFRVGNLFFEMNPYGYSLVHYPEKYLAFETRL